jgi:hypothetical protein
MKRTIVLMLILLGSATLTLNAQKASDVIENGIHVKKGQKIFLMYDHDENVMKFDVNTTPKDYTTLPDSTFFLVEKNGSNVYILPFNPIVYSLKTENKIIVDPINEQAITTLEAMLNIFQKTGEGHKLTDSVENKEICNSNISQALESLIKDLKDNKQKELSENFDQMLGLSFKSEASTIEDLKRIKEKIDGVGNYFSRIEKKIDTLQQTITSANNGFICQYIYTDILKTIGEIKSNQKTRYVLIDSLYKEVSSAQKKYTDWGWMVPLKEVPSVNGKISIFTVTLNKKNYKTSSETFVSSTESTLLTKKTLRIRKFQRFVPEVSIGTAYTFFQYPVYGIRDSAGQNYISSSGENFINNLKFTAMVNFNYFIPHSPLHPFWQIGIGVNAEVPTLLTGFGIRSNINGLRRFALSGGIALTWIKQLNTLQVGDPVKGTSDIDNDLKYSFSWPPKPYIGIQYNF